VQDGVPTGRDEREGTLADSDGLVMRTSVEEIDY
jgi:hypothetical protein